MNELAKKLSYNFVYRFIYRIPLKSLPSSALCKNLRTILLIISKLQPENRTAKQIKTPYKQKIFSAAKIWLYNGIHK
jgi:hypothetical protein